MASELDELSKLSKLSRVTAELPVIDLGPGVSDWREANELGQALSAAFPGQDADELMMAVCYNEAGPLTGRTITELVMVKQGYNDGPSWEWHLSLDDGSRWVATGGCDYSGWDCQSDLRWAPA